MLNFIRNCTSLTWSSISPPPPEYKSTHAKKKWNFTQFVHAPFTINQTYCHLSDVQDFWAHHPSTYHGEKRVPLKLNMKTWEYYCYVKWMKCFVEICVKQVLTSRTKFVSWDYTIHFLKLCCFPNVPILPFKDSRKPLTNK